MTANENIYALEHMYSNQSGKGRSSDCTLQVPLSTKTRILHSSSLIRNLPGHLKYEIAFLINICVQIQLDTPLI